MLINTKNISTFNATLIDRKFTNHEIINVNDWLDGAPAPVFLREYDRYKEMELTFLFENTTEQLMISDIDRLVVELKRNTIKFSDLTYYYDSHMEGVINMEKMTNKAYMVTALLLVHRTYLPLVTNNVDGALSFNWGPLGTKATPLKITLNPYANQATITINGLSKSPIVVKSLTANTDHIIDGFTYRYLKNGANDIANFGGFDFPIREPGSKAVTVSKQTRFKIEYYPQFN